MSKEFNEFMNTVKGYPELEGTMNLCNDIINNREISDEEIEEASRQINYGGGSMGWIKDAFKKGAKWYRDQLKTK